MCVVDKEKTKQATFTKEQFLNSRHRSGMERNVLSVVLEDGKSYTAAEAEKALQAYFKRSVI